MAAVQKTAQELPPRLQQCHERAVQALKAGNARVAAELLAALIAEEPGCAEARRALCEARLAASGGPPKGLRRCLAKARLAWPLQRTGPALLQAGRTDEALRLADKLLCVDPSSRDVLLFLARCSAAVGASAAAAETLEVAVLLFPGDAVCWRALAEQCAKARRPVRAAEAHRRLADLCPGDVQVREALRRAAAAAVPARESSPGVVAPVPGAQAAAAPATQESLEAQTARAEARLSQDSSPRACRDLAQLYLRAERFADAVALLQQVMARPGLDDSALADDLAGAYRAQAEAALATWSQCARSSPDRAAEAERERAAIVRERDRRVLELRRQQAARHPHDNRRHYELAERLVAQGEWAEALEHFEAARSHPNLKARALAGMGRCCAGTGQHEQAVPLFQQALDAGVGGPLRDRLAVMYDMALSCDRVGRSAEANALIKDIFAQDRTFRDVADRIQRLAAAAPAGPARQ